MSNSKEFSSNSQGPPPMPKAPRSRRSASKSQEKSKPEVGHVPANQVPVLTYMSKVRTVRESLRAKAEEILNAYLETVVEAREAGEVEVAVKALQYLMEHMPADQETGEKLLDPSVDKQPKQIEKGKTGPNISIGVAIGGIPQNKELTPKSSQPMIEVVGEVIENE